MSQQAYIFGTAPWDNIPQSSSWHGEQNWWTVPQNWFWWQEGFQQYVSPNANHEPRYAVKIDYDGTGKFQDPYRTRLAEIGQLTN